MASALIALGSHAQAQIPGVQIPGVDGHVSHGKRMPTVAQLTTVLAPGDYVCDVLGWARVDKGCNPSGDASNAIVIATNIITLYEPVQTAQERNFVTLKWPRRGVR